MKAILLALILAAPAQAANISSGKRTIINFTGGGGSDPTKLPLAGGTMTGSIGFSSGTGISQILNAGAERLEIWSSQGNPSASILSISTRNILMQGPMDPVGSTITLQAKYLSLAAQNEATLSGAGGTIFKAAPGGLTLQGGGGNITLYAPASYIALNSIGGVSISTGLSVGGIIAGASDINAAGSMSAGQFRAGLGITPNNCGVSAGCLASCPGGQNLLGGGCLIAGGASSYIQASYPASSTAWRCTQATNGLTAGAIANLTAYAICADIAP